MTVEKRTGNSVPRPKYGKTHKYNRWVRFVDLNEAIEDINFENASLNTVEELRKVEVEGRVYGSYFNVLGYNKPNDLGGGVFYWDPLSEESQDNGLVIKSNHSKKGRWYRVIEDYVSPEMFGAVGDGVVNDTKAFQTCLSIGGNIKLAGHYLLNHVSGTQPYYNITGTGDAVLDFTESDQDRTNCIDYGDFELKGSYEQIADLSLSPARFTKTINFASAHDLSPGDLFVIWDPRDGSWNPMRDEYQAGEICEVAKVVSSTEVEVADFLFDTYDFNFVEVHKLNTIKVNASNFKILGGGNPPPFLNFQSNYGFQIGGVRDLVLENIQFEGSFRHTLNVANAYNVSIKNISIDHIEEAPLYNYGLLYANAQNVWITNCNINALGDSIETSSGVPLQGSSVSFPIRRATVRSVSASTIISQHGHAEYGYVSECFSNGVTLGGDRSDVTNCYVSGNIELARESVGMNFTATGNTVKGGISATQCADAECRYPNEVQKIRIEGNTIEGSRISLPGVWSGGADVGYEYHMFIENNKILNDPVSLTGAITLAGNGNSTVNYLSIKGNDINGHIDIRTRNFGYKVAVIENNTIRNGARSSILVHYGLAYIKNNLILDMARNRAIPLEDTNFLIGFIDTLHMSGNTIGDTVENADGQWISLYNTSTSNIYMSDNNNLNQPSNEIYFGPNASMSDIKPCFTGKSNPNQGKATILSGTNSITISGLELSSDYLNIQLTGTESETASPFVTNITSSGFDIEVGSAVTADREVYWKLEG